MNRYVLAIIFAVVPTLASAQNERTPVPSPTVYDTLWAKLTDWYDDKENPVVQRVLFTGRFHHDLAMVEADQGNWRESNIRRARVGTRVTLFRDFLVHAEVEVNPQERDPFYMRLTDAYVTWQKHPKAVITAGKQSIPFTQEGATSSRELVTIDRSNLANNIWFTQEYIPGVSVSGRAARWLYRGGIYSSGAMNREFGRFNGGTFTLALLGYDFAKALGVREAVLTGNYVYQRPHQNNTFTKRFENIGSLHFRLDEPRWGVRADVSAASGSFEQRDVRGAMVMPYFNATPKLQLVYRYTWLDSDGPNGLGLAAYESRVANGRGDRYHEHYAGVNYYFYGHRLKLQSGVQFADMRDGANDGGAYAGAAWVNGLRVGW